jgi:hypothetical protein
MADPAYIVDGVLTDGEAWVGIAHASLSLPAASVNWISTDDGQTGDFSQYMDLFVIAYTHGSAGAIYDNGYMRFNDDSGSNYAYQYFNGDGSATDAGSGTTTGASFRTLGSSAGANEFSAWIGHVFDINSGKYKSVIGMSASDSDGDGWIKLGADTWKSQAAINKVTLVPSTGNWPTGSVFDLFGILPRMVA